MEQVPQKGWVVARSLVLSRLGVGLWSPPWTAVLAPPPVPESSVPGDPASPKRWFWPRRTLGNLVALDELVSCLPTWSRAISLSLKASALTRTCLWRRSLGSSHPEAPREV